MRHLVVCVLALACATAMAGVTIKPRNFDLSAFKKKDMSKVPATAAAEEPTPPPQDPVAIIGGNEVDDASTYPFHVALVFELHGELLGQFCGGVILDETHIVTAAHCVSDAYFFEAGLSVKVIAGSTTLPNFGGDGSGSDSSGAGPLLEAFASQFADTVQIRDACSAVTANTYGSFTEEFFNDDLAVVSLTEPFLFNRFVGAIDLPSAGQPMPGAIVTAIGHGETETGLSSNILKEVDLMVLDSDICQAVFEGINPDTVFCTIDPDYLNDFLDFYGSNSGSGFVFPPDAGDSSDGSYTGIENSCFGDSGGALFVRSDTPSGFTLVGLTSFGPDCTLLYPAGNTRVAGFDERISTGLSLGSDVCCPPYTEPVFGSGSGSDAEQNYVCEPCRGNHAGAMCEVCPSGSFKVPNGFSSVCHVCPAGSYHADPEHPFCTSCPEGTTSSEGSTTCDVMCEDTQRCPSFNCDILRVEITPDFFFFEISWQVTEHTPEGAVVIASGSDLGGSASMCGNNPITFSVFDSFGDGICCDYGFGFIELYVNDVFVEGINGDYGPGISVNLPGNSDCNACFPPGPDGSGSGEGDCDALVPDVRMWRGNFIMTLEAYTAYCSRRTECPSPTNVVILSGVQWVLAPSQDSFEVAPDKCAGLA